MPNKSGEPALFRDLRHALPIALLRARETVMAQFRPMLARHDLTEQQWRVIRALAEHGQIDASELSARAFVLAPSLTRILRSLEERNLVDRIKDKRDGRRVLLSINEKSWRVIREVAPEARQTYQRIAEAFGQEREEQLLQLLDALATIEINNDPDSRTGG